MAMAPLELHTPLKRTVRGYLSLGPFSIAVKPPKYPERGRGFTVKSLPSFLFLPAGAGRLHSGFGWAASASRNTLALLLSTTTVPVSTQAGMAGAGAVRQSLNSCTAL